MWSLDESAYCTLLWEIRMAQISYGAVSLEEDTEATPLLPSEVSGEATRLQLPRNICENAASQPASWAGPAAESWDALGARNHSWYSSLILILDSLSLYPNSGYLKLFLCIFRKRSSKLSCLEGQVTRLRTVFVSGNARVWLEVGPWQRAEQPGTKWVFVMCESLDHRSYFIYKEQVGK